MDERLNPMVAQSMIRQIAKTGTVTFVKPNIAEVLRRRNLTMVDVANAILCGRVGEPERENGAWRYPVYTNKIHVVVEIDCETELLVITAWRI